MKLEYVFTDITELSYKKDLQNSTDLEIQTRMDYTVYYSDDSHSCMGRLQIELSPPNNKELCVRYCSNSIFNLKDVTLDDELKKEIHVETYNRLYPLCFTHVKNFLSLIGLPDIPMTPIDFSQSSISINSEKNT